MNSPVGMIPEKTSSVPRPLEIASKLLLLFGLLYLFVLSITLLGGAFKLFGSDFSKTIFQATANPIVGLMIGILVTAVIQSSSTTTTMIIGMVAAGATVSSGLTFEAAIPMVMGANIGTSVTNIIVSLGHISRGDEFRRAFAGSMLHDFFNLCAVAVLLPIEMLFHPIQTAARFAEETMAGFGGLTFSSPLKAVTEPLATWIIHMTGDSAWLSIIVSLLFLGLALHFIVKVLKLMVLSRVEKFFQRYIFRTPALGFALGIVITATVQSSSITTSLVVPLIGAGVITLVQVYPYLLGANIGTTITAFLASFVTGSADAVAVAFAHLLFNIFGIVIFWPLRAIPMWLAKKLSVLTQWSKWVPIIYIVVVFFIIPGAVIYFMR